MKQLLNFLPLIIFFTFYKLYDIFAATQALMAATAATLALSYVLYRKVEKSELITFLMVAFFGTLTLAFHSDLFIKWKVTVIYAVFALALLGSQFIFKQTLIQKMLGKELPLPDSVWNRLNIAWSLFFIACGLLNIYVAFWLSQEVWVNFKVFGLTGLTLLFTLFSGVYIFRHMPSDAKPKDDV